MSGPAQWSNHLRLTARLYEPLWRGRSIGVLTGGSYSTERELEAMIERLALPVPSTVIDLGCSAGLYARRLAALGHDVVGVDVSRAFLVEGERLAADEGVAVHFVHADVHALPFPDASFDAAVCGGSLNEFADAPRALREAARVLRPGAPLWLMYVGRAEGAFGRVPQVLLRASGLRFPRAVDVAAWCSDAGLTGERSVRRGPLVLASYRKGSGLAPVAASSPAAAWDGPTPLRNRRFNWERHGSRDPQR
ncbi:MAG: class I SAM-dependent methyltransferase [Trueperaceae bacterium]|nr:class I SAM-dependent methyltransferase [Trueperaceae bacterium]